MDIDFVFEVEAGIIMPCMVAARLEFIDARKAGGEFINQDCMASFACCILNLGIKSRANKIHKSMEQDETNSFTTAQRSACYVNPGKKRCDLRACSMTNLVTCVSHVGSTLESLSEENLLVNCVSRDRHTLEFLAKENSSAWEFGGLCAV